MRVTVDYSVWLGVTVDTETGEVVAVGHGDDLCGEPESFFNSDFGENDAPEYLPADHPDAVKALAAVNTIHLNGEANWFKVARS